MSFNVINRRDFLKTMGIGASTLAFPGCGKNARQEKKKISSERPNIVLIMNDDMGFSDIGCYGGEVNTPNLDKLAAHGLKFKQFYNTARCCPTRASLLTGLYQHQAGVGHMMEDSGFDGYRGDLSRNCVTIAEVLKQAGYATYMSGKWHVTKHLGHWTCDRNLMSKHNWPCQRGFDRFYGTIIGCGSFYDPVTLTRDNTPIEPESERYYYTDAITENALTYINDHVDEKPGEPFFCYIAYTSPHWPMHALPEDIAKYRGRYDMGWDALREERYKRMIDMGIIDQAWKLTDRDDRVPPWEQAENKEWQSRRMEVYAAMIDRMDQDIGRIVSVLEENGHLDNTLIMFLADNGGCAEELTAGWGSQLFIPEKTRDGRPVKRDNDPAIMPGPDDTYQSYGLPWANASNTPFRLYKHWVHEGGISTPFIAHWPSRINSPGEWRNQPGHLIDIMATCADVSGAQYPDDYNGTTIIPMEGTSLVPAFDNNPLGREAIYWEHEGNRAVRKGKWKLVSKYPGDWELFDIEADRTEMNNLAGSQPELVNELAAMWNAWAKRSFVAPWEDVQKGLAEFRKHFNNRTRPEKGTI